MDIKQTRYLIERAESHCTTNGCNKENWKTRLKTSRIKQNFRCLMQSNYH